MNKHILVSLTSHGYGHIGQTAPILDALQAAHPDWKISIRSAAAPSKLIERFGAKVHLQSVQTEIGMIQKNALEVLLEPTLTAYHDFHKNWQEKIEREAEALQALNPDLVFANVPYLALAAAAHVGIPSIAYSSLNWADVFQYYFAKQMATDPAVLKMYEQMLQAYNSARCFLQPIPSIDMPNLTNGTSVGPVAQYGTHRRSELNQQMGIAETDKLAVISLGGMELTFPVASWPRFPGWKLIVPAGWDSSHPDTLSTADINMPFIDILTSADVLVAKPGYGSFSEAACSGTPVLYLQRTFWPESPYLVSWLEKVGCCQEVSAENLSRGNFCSQLNQLHEQTVAPVPRSGITEILEHVYQSLN